MERLAGAPSVAARRRRRRLSAVRHGVRRPRGTPRVRALARGLHDCAEPRTYRPEHARYGSGASLDAVERHFMAASRCAGTLLAGRPGLAERLSAGFAVLLLAWTVVEPDADRRLACLRAGAEAWRRMLGPDYDTEGFDRAYERSRTALVRRAGHLLDAGPTLRPDGAEGPLGSWHRSVSRLHGELEVLERDGEFAPALDALRDDPSPALPARPAHRPDRQPLRTPHVQPARTVRTAGGPAASFRRPRVR
ncbi:lantibiotic dehydratase C-terminal domain-containing protein [Streptomyces libani]